MDYCRTRYDCMKKIHELVKGKPENVLLAFDFPFGYPHGSSLQGGRDAAQMIASQMMDAENDLNNRFEVAEFLNQSISTKSGPFWGHPKSRKFENLTWQKPPFSHTEFQEWRICEKMLKSRNHKIMNVWQLLGQGSVGSQTLTGLARLFELCQSDVIGKNVRFWPFETNWDQCLNGTILAEVWPSLNRYSEIEHPIKDARQILACLRWLKKENDSGSIKNIFEAPKSLSEKEKDFCRNEEGWILGVK